MKNFKKLHKQCPDGIPFSKCKEYLEKEKEKNKKKTKKNSKKKSSKKRQNKIPPKNVIIREKDILYRSNGISLIPI